MLAQPDLAQLAHNQLISFWFSCFGLVSVLKFTPLNASVMAAIYGSWSFCFNINLKVLSHLLKIIRPWQVKICLQQYYSQCKPIDDCWKHMYVMIFAKWTKLTWFAVLKVNGWQSLNLLASPGIGMVRKKFLW